LRGGDRFGAAVSSCAVHELRDTVEGRNGRVAIVAAGSCWAATALV
jgi:hypothetical protein